MCKNATWWCAKLKRTENSENSETDLAIVFPLHPSLPLTRFSFSLLSVHFVKPFLFRGLNPIFLFLSLRISVDLFLCNRLQLSLLYQVDTWDQCNNGESFGNHLCHCSRSTPIVPLPFPTETPKPTPSPLKASFQLHDNLTNSISSSHPPWAGGIWPTCRWARTPPWR